MSIQAVRGCKFVFDRSHLVAKANGATAELLGYSKGVKSARFLINPLYVAENPEMMLSPCKFIQEIKRGVEVMKAAEANGNYLDISNEVLWDFSEISL